MASVVLRPPLGGGRPNQGHAKGHGRRAAGGTRMVTFPQPFVAWSFNRPMDANDKSKSAFAALQLSGAEVRGQSPPEVAQQRMWRDWRHSPPLLGSYVKWRVDWCHRLSGAKPLTD